MIATSLLILGLLSTAQAGTKPKTSPLDKAREAVEQRMTEQTMFRNVSVTSDTVKKVRTISVTFRSVEPLSPAENVTDMYGLVWQALFKNQGFKAVDRITVRGTGPRPYAVDCPSKVVEDSSGYMSSERMNGGCKRLE